MIPSLIGLNRQERRQVILHMERENQKFPEALVRLPVDDIPPSRPGWMVPIEVWRSREFLVQVFSEKFDGALEPVLRLTVNRTHVDPVSLEWLAGITWDELQEVKRQVGRGHLEAVEIYPPDSDVVNVGNLRHLWVLPARMPFSWGSGRHP